VVSLDYDDGEGSALITRDDLSGIGNALKRAKRVRLSFTDVREEAGEGLEGKAKLVLDTELIRYKWTSVDGSFPDWRKLIPSEFKTSVSFDTVEAVKAVSSLKVLANSKTYPLDLTIGNSKLTMSSPDDKGQAEIAADSEGEGFIRVEGKYLAEALKACGGMVELKFASPVSPMLFTAVDFQLVVMPMFTEKAKQAEQAKTDAEAKVEKPVEPTEVATPAEVSQPETEPAEPVEADKPKRKRRAKEPVAVA
jgi:hypothetical protein